MTFAVCCQRAMSSGTGCRPRFGSRGSRSGSGTRPVPRAKWSITPRPEGTAPVPPAITNEPRSRSARRRSRCRRAAQKQRGPDAVLESSPVTRPTRRIVSSTQPSPMPLTEIGASPYFGWRPRKTVRGFTAPHRRDGRCTPFRVAHMSRISERKGNVSFTGIFPHLLHGAVELVAEI